MSMLLALFLAAPVHATGLDCPDGTGPVRSVRPDGLVEDGCALLGGIPHGPSVTRGPDGVVRERGEWTDGARTGEWRFYDAAGRSREVGNYAGGSRVGTWTTLGPDGVPVATLFHDALPGAPPVVVGTDARVRWAEGKAPVLHALPAPAADDHVGDGASTAPGLEPDRSAGVSVTDTGVRVQPHVLPWGGDVVHVDAAGLTARSLADGAGRWSSRPADGLASAPVRSRRFLGAVTGTGMVLVVDPDAGQQVRIRTAAGATHVAAVDQDTVWLRDGVGRLAAWSWEDGSVRWQTRRAYGRVSPVYADRVVVAARGREVTALEASTGTKRWSTRLDAEVVVLAPGLDGTVLAVSRTGAVERLSGADGAPLATLQAPGRDRPPGRLRDGADGAVWRSLDAVGRLGGVKLGGFASWPDLADGLACGASPSGGVRCRAPGAAADRLRLAGVTAVGQVRLLGETLLVPTASGLVALDLTVALATSDAPSEGLPVVLLPVGGDPVEARLAVDVVERAGDEQGCLRTDAVVDLEGVSAVLADDLGGSVPGFGVLVPELEVQWEDGEAEWRFGEAWGGELLDARWEAPYSVAWRPELLTVTPIDGSAAAAAALERLLECDGPGATFRGQAIAVQAGRRLVLEGRLRLEPWAHEVGGAPGCLVDLAVDGADLGPFRPSAVAGWMDLHLIQEGGDTGPVIPDSGLPLPAGFDSGELFVETLMPGALDRVELGLGTPVSLGLEEAWPSGVDLVIRDGAGTERLRLPGDDLQLDAPPLHTEWWAVRSSRLFVPGDAGTSVLWSRSDCGADGRITD